MAYLKRRENERREHIQRKLAHKNVKILNDIIIFQKKKMATEKPPGR